MKLTSPVNEEMAMLLHGSQTVTTNLLPLFICCAINSPELNGSAVGCVPRCEMFVMTDAQNKRSARRLNVVLEVKAILCQNVLESVNYRGIFLMVMLYAFLCLCLNYMLMRYMKVPRDGTVGLLLFFLNKCTNRIG